MKLSVHFFVAMFAASRCTDPGVPHQSHRVFHRQGSNGLQPGTRVSYTCKSGYRLIDSDGMKHKHSSYAIECQQNGKWNLPLPSCRRMCVAFVGCKALVFFDEKRSLNYHKLFICLWYAMSALHCGIPVVACCMLFVLARTNQNRCELLTSPWYCLHSSYSACAIHWLSFLVFLFCVISVSFWCLFGVFLEFWKQSKKGECACILIQNICWNSLSKCTGIATIELEDTILQLTCNTIGH